MQKKTKKKTKRIASSNQYEYNEVVLSSVHIQTYARAYKCMNDAQLLNNLTSQPTNIFTFKCFDLQRTLCSACVVVCFIFNLF